MTEKEIILKQIDILQARQETEGLNVDQTQKEFDDLLEESIDGIYQASIK